MATPQDYNRKATKRQHHLTLFVAGLLLASAGGASAATHYVDQNSTNATPPYTSWSTAATNIQDAVDAAVAGDEIVVTNGTYSPIDSPLSVRSINGAQFTIIDGGHSNRCASLSSDASLSGFTLTNGYGFVGGGAYGGTLIKCILTGNRARFGGGAHSSTLSNCTLTGNSTGLFGAGGGGGATGSTLNNCILSGNSASGFGGGASECTLTNCTLSGNSAAVGGGANGGTLNNCTLTGNTASNFGGGVYSSTLTNCIVYFNTCTKGINYDPSSTLNYCCTTPLPTNGVGNVSSDPQLASASHLSALSPCIGKGSYAAVSGTDIDGEPWANPPSIGCDEYHAGAVTGPLSVAISASFTNVAVGYPVDFTAMIGGPTDLSVWDFGDGALEINQPYAAHSWAMPGDYPVSLWCFNDSYPGGISASMTIHVGTGIHYVAATSANPTPPYSSWAAAATNIQDAIAAATEAGPVVVLVTNGTYAPITASGPVSVRSINGALVTVIDGGHSNQCASLSNDGSLSGFTLTNGYASLGGGASGGILSNCTLSGNSAWNGGGASGCTLNNCALSGNSASYGGAADGCTLNNCTLTGNAATNSGGGAQSCTLNNCITYFNTARNGANYDTDSTLNYCCTTPQTTNGTGNISLDPQLASASHLSAGSPCRGTGSAAYANGTDIDGEVWLSPPSIGCDELHVGAVTGPVNVAVGPTFTNVAVGYALRLMALIEGRTTASVWDFGDGVAIANQPFTSHAWTMPGDYTVVLRAYNESHDGAVSASVTIHMLTQPIRYVMAENPNPAAPYLTWATAATNIQDALDAASEAGALVLVTNGCYTPITANNPVSVRTVNGAQVTLIDAGHSSRCVTLGNDADLSGFTLTNGLSQMGGGAFGGTLSNCKLTGNSAGNGGGAYNCALYKCTLSGNWVSGGDDRYGGGAFFCTLTNCTLSSNWASGTYNTYGGGAVSCTLTSCILSDNSAYGYNGVGGGGAADCTLSSCSLSSNWASGTYNTYGGGAVGCTLTSCILSDNSAYGYYLEGGGGAADCTLSSCRLTANSANYGGGASGGTLNNCTLTGNSAAFGGGTFGGTLNNCIAYFNTAPVGANYESPFLNYCCTTPLPAGGFGNVTNAPLFVDTNAWANLRLQSNSPCINAGNNSYLTNSYFTNSFDLDDNPRIVGGTVDIGAYEFQSPTSITSYAWLQQYGLPTDGSADFTDPDGDGLNNWQEWRCGTDPTNALSALGLLAPSPTGTNVTVTWQSVAGVNYFLERSTNLTASPAFVPLATSVFGQAGTTSFTDTNVVGAGPFFYRVGVGN
jgi:hypothetical protein